MLIQDYIYESIPMMSNIGLQDTRYDSIQVMSCFGLLGTRHNSMPAMSSISLLGTRYDSLPIKSSNLEDKGMIVEQSSCDLLRIGMTVELRCALFPC